MHELLDGRLIVKTGDITRETVDIIVNAANSTLLGGGGVDGAIHRAGGPAILQACKQVRSEQYPNGLPTGKAVATTAGRLDARWIVHTVGPVWGGGNRNEDALLADCYRNSLAAAERLGAASIAFPAISTGVYHFPKPRATGIAYTAIKTELPRIPGLTVSFVFFSEADMQVFLENIPG